MKMNKKTPADNGPISCHVVILNGRVMGGSYSHETARAIASTFEAPTVVKDGIFVPLPFHKKTTGDMPATLAPDWWFSLFHQGHHDLSVYEIEWAYDAFVRTASCGPLPWRRTV